MTKKTKLLSDEIAHLNPCRDAVAWINSQSDRHAAWRDCQRGDWMLWLLGNLAGMNPESKARRKLTLCACEIARRSLKFVRYGEDRPRLAIEAAEDFARGGGATRDQVRDAAYAAAAAYAAYAAATAAAYAAAYAAATAAADAADAYAYTAADAADAYAAADARKNSLEESADIVRKHYPTCPKIKRKGAERTCKSR